MSIGALSSNKRKACEISPDLNTEECDQISAIRDSNSHKAQVLKLLNPLIQVSNHKPFSQATYNALEELQAFLMNTSNLDENLLKEAGVIIERFTLFYSTLPGTDLPFSLDTAKSFEAAHTLITEFRLCNLLEPLKPIHRQLVQEMSILFENKCRLCRDQNAHALGVMIEEINQHRKALTTKLASDILLPPLREHPPVLDKHDLIIWAMMSAKINLLVQMAKFCTSDPLKEIVFTLTQPLSLSEREPSKPTEEKVSKVFQELQKNPISSPYLIKESYAWKYQSNLGKGSFKTVHKMRHVVSGVMCAFARSTFRIMDTLSLKKGAAEANLMVKLRGKKGWAQVSEITYSPVIQGNKFLQIEQGILMTPYHGDGCALLSFLAQNPSYNTPQNKLQMFKTLVKGLQLLHEEHGLIHQDVKAANILFSPNEGNTTTSVVLTDLGTVCPIGVKGIDEGTWETAPQEYLLAIIKEHNHLIHSKDTPKPDFFKDAVQPSLDVYGLGLIAYSWYIGFNPHHPSLKPVHAPRNLVTHLGDNKYFESLDLHLNTHVLPLLEKVWFKEPPQDNKIIHLIWKMCHNDIKIRPSSMAEVLQVLDSLSDD